MSYYRYCPRSVFSVLLQRSAGGGYISERLPTLFQVFWCVVNLRHSVALSTRGRNRDSLIISQRAFLSWDRPTLYLSSPIVVIAETKSSIPRKRFSDACQRASLAHGPVIYGVVHHLTGLGLPKANTLPLLLLPAVARSRGGGTRPRIS